MQHNFQPSLAMSSLYATNHSPPHPHQLGGHQREAARPRIWWRSPSPPLRERRASAPLEDKTPEGPVTEEGEVEVEVQPRAEAGDKEMAE